MTYQYSSQKFSGTEHRLVRRFGVEYSAPMPEPSPEEISLRAGLLRQKIEALHDDNDVQEMREAMQLFFKKNINDDDIERMNAFIQSFAKRIDEDVSLPNFMSEESIGVFAVESGMLTQGDIIRFQTERALNTQREEIDHPQGRIYKKNDIRTRYVNGHKFEEICVKSGTVKTAKWAPYKYIESIHDARARKDAMDAMRREEEAARAREAREHSEHIDRLRYDAVYRNSYETRQRLVSKFGGTIADYGRINTKPQDRYTDRTGADLREFLRRNPPPIVEEVTTTVHETKNVTPTTIEFPERDTVVAPGSPQPTVEQVRLKDGVATLDRIGQEIPLDDGIVMRKTADDVATLFVDEKDWGRSSRNRTEIKLPAKNLLIRATGSGKFQLIGTGAEGTLERTAGKLELKLHSVADPSKTYETSWTNREAVRDMRREQTQKAMEANPGQKWVSIPNGFKDYVYRLDGDKFYAKNSKGEIYYLDPITKKAVRAGQEF